MGNMLFLCLSLSRIFTRVGHSAALPACSTDTTEKYLISDFQECCICWTALQAGSPPKRSQALLDNTYKMLTISYNSRFHSPREVAKSDSLYCNFLCATLFYIDKLFSTSWHQYNLQPIPEEKSYGNCQNLQQIIHHHLNLV